MLTASVTWYLRQLCKQDLTCVASDEETRAHANKKQDIKLNPGSREPKTHDRYTGPHCRIRVEESTMALIISGKKWKHALIKLNASACPLALRSKVRACPETSC